MTGGCSREGNGAFLGRRKKERMGRKIKPKKGAELATAERICILTPAPGSQEPYMGRSE